MIGCRVEPPRVDHLAAPRAPSAGGDAAGDSAAGDTARVRPRSRCGSAPDAPPASQSPAAGRDGAPDDLDPGHGASPAAHDNYPDGHFPAEARRFRIGRLARAATIAT